MLQCLAPDPTAMSANHHHTWGNVDLEPKALRNLFGSYPTGVAIVTTRTPDGRAVGLTINSFATLSLAPPLVLWSLVDRSPNLDAFRACSHFAINILANGHEALAKRFASAAVPDKFDGVALQETPEACPRSTARSRPWSAPTTTAGTSAITCCWSGAWCAPPISRVRRWSSMPAASRRCMRPRRPPRSSRTAGDSP